MSARRLPAKPPTGPKANPKVGQNVAHQGGLWSCWSQAPGVGQWWLMPVDERARRVYARTKYGKQQGCLQVAAKDLFAPVTQNLKPEPEDEWEQEELL